MDENVSREEKRFNFKTPTTADATKPKDLRLLSRVVAR